MTGSNGYDFEPPEELLPWLEHQRELEQRDFELGFGGYILQNGKVKRVSFEELGEWFMSGERQIEDSTLTIGDSEVWVSTVFLCYDHGFSFFHREGCRPVLFETMIFGGPEEIDQLQWRYSSLGEAKNGHYKILEALRAGHPPHTLLEEGGPGIWMLFKDMFDDPETEEDEDDDCAGTPS